MKPSRSSLARGGFTLIEIMVVIAIIGLIMAMGMPAIMNAFKREGMRKAIWEIDETCKQARSDAIFHNQVTWVIFYPDLSNPRYQLGGEPIVGGDALEMEPAKSSSSLMKPATADRLPDGVEIAMFDINRMDFAESSYGRVRFFPDGTCDEMTMVLQAKEQYRKLTLEYSTAMLDVSEVNQ